MAQIQQQIDPLDLTPSTGVGVSLPFNGPGVFNTNYTTQDQTKSNLINLVLTEPGERVYKPFFGVGLNSLLFEQNVSKKDLQEKIMGKPITQTFSTNNTLNSLLSETAQGNTNTESTMMDPEAPMPTSVANVVNRDYRSLMKAIENKKGR